jgi:transcriptional regulator with XRE-family HTH domain
MAFGKNIRRAREGRDMTLTELARRVQVSIAYLSRIERKRENPPPDHEPPGRRSTNRLPPEG